MTSHGPTPNSLSGGMGRSTVTLTVASASPAAFTALTTYVPSSCKQHKIIITCCFSKPHHTPQAISCSRPILVWCPCTGREELTCRSVSLMKREPSASWMKRSLSRGSSLCSQVTSGAGVPEASQMRVVGCPADVNTSGLPTFRTGAKTGQTCHSDLIDELRQDRH